MYEIGLPEFEVINRIITDSDDYLYEIKPVQDMTNCTACGSASIKKHKKLQRKVRDLNEYTHRVGLIINVHTYKCNDCGRVFGDEFDTIDGSDRLTKRLKAQIQMECFDNTFKKLSDTYSVSQSTIKRLFNEYVEELSNSNKLYSPQVLGIDEVHLHSQYCGVYVDVLGHKVIEMTANRSKATVLKFLKSLPESNKIECVTMDMWRPYFDAVSEVLPNVPVVIDKFHVVKELNNALETIRRELRKNMAKKSYASLKNFRYLLLSGSETLSSRENTQLDNLFKAYPEFETPYLLKEAFRNIYLFAESKEQAEQLYKEWVESCKAEKCTAYNDFIKTVNNWHNEIFNYFDNRYTNAQTESLNNIIREVDRAGRGYTFEILRAKVLFRNLTVKKGKFSF